MPSSARVRLRRGVLASLRVEREEPGVAWRQWGAVCSGARKMFDRMPPQYEMGFCVLVIA